MFHWNSIVPPFDSLPKTRFPSPKLRTGEGDILLRSAGGFEKTAGGGL